MQERRTRQLGQRHDDDSDDDDTLAKSLPNRAHVDSSCRRALPNLHSRLSSSYKRKYRPRLTAFRVALALI